MQRSLGLRSELTMLIAAAGVALLASPTASAEPVDVELVLAVDVSLSMSPMELDIQRRGYIAALTHEEVLQAIREGVHGRIAVTYFEWAGEFTQRMVVPWTIIADDADARAFVAKLEGNVPSSARRTSISSALNYAADLFAESSFTGMKRVIDISGDGPNNQGAPVTDVRDAIIDQGITINGLPLMTSGDRMTSFDFEELDVYYSNCVIGGPGAFMVPVNEWNQFPEAIRRKLVMELAGTMVQPAGFDGSRPAVILAQTAEQYDCQIGEKMWGDRYWMWDQR